MSELQVATMGRVGCGAVSQVRSRDGGVKSERWVMATAAMTNQLMALAKGPEEEFCF